MASKATIVVNLQPACCKSIEALIAIAKMKSGPGNKAANTMKIIAEAALQNIAEHCNEQGCKDGCKK